MAKRWEYQLYEPDYSPHDWLDEWDDALRQFGEAGWELIAGPDPEGSRMARWAHFKKELS